MKRISYLTFSVLLFACGTGSENTEVTKFSNLTFSLDTVMVDAGEEIINLRNSLWVSAVDASASYLYNWDQDNTLLEKINLDQLVLEQKIPFEKEGPNGTGSPVSWMTLTEENHILFSNWGNIGLFNQRGEKLKTYKLKGEKFKGDTLQDNEMLYRGAILAKGGEEINGILGTLDGKTFTYLRVDFGTNHLKKHPLPDYDKISDYSVKFISPKMSMVSGIDQNVDLIDNKIILSNSVFNSLMVYDLSLDSLYRVEYNTSLTKTSKTGKYRKEVDSEEEFRQILTEIGREINFKRPLWDSTKQRYYRFSYETLPQEDNLEQGRKFKHKIFLTILDKDFKLLGESEVKELDYLPSIHFVKDGKIWLYENIDDELAFVRLSMI